MFLQIILALILIVPMVIVGIIHKEDKTQPQQSAGIKHNDCLSLKPRGPPI